MSNQLVRIKASIDGMSIDFKEQAKIHGAVNFEKEASFAIQAMSNNTYLAGIAISSPESLRFAVLNVASIGISLNPALKQAYLIPRKGKAILDISYMGLVHLACESGAIKWVQAEVVRQKDTYEFTGVGEKPIHKFSPFGDRGEIIGVYVIAKTEDNEFLSDQMSIDEVFAIRDRTESWKAFIKSGKTKLCPWSTDAGEMIKKTVIKRAFKLWPKNDKTARLNEAVDVLNETEGINFNDNPPDIVELANDDLNKEIQGLILETDSNPERLMTYLKIDSFENITIETAKKALNALNQKKDQLCLKK
jgi:recombination protein RecT